MIYSGVNWSFMQPPLAEGDVLENCNLAQLRPDTSLAATIQDLTFLNCNCVNVRPQRNWLIVGGNWCQKTFCTNEHPELIARGLKACGEDCAHRLGDQKIPVEISEKEYRELQALQGQMGVPVVSVNTLTDAAGVAIQTFTKAAYPYKSTVTRSGSAALRAVAVQQGEVEP